jgi:hypothetical protein
MKMVKGAEDAVYLNLQTKFNTLVKSIKKIEFAIGGRDIAYLQTMTHRQFRKEKLADITIDATNKIAYYEFGDQKHNIVISRSISEDILSQLATDSANDESWNKYRISLCENNNVQFYMLHKCIVLPKYTSEVQNRYKELQEILSNLVQDEMFSQVLEESEAIHMKSKIKLWDWIKRIWTRS